MQSYKLCERPKDPKECKYFNIDNHCKFGDYCAFEHKKRKENQDLEKALKRK